jgi:PQQ-dependent dehydrogenase (methanol/ethanol family)
MRIGILIVAGLAVMLSTPFASGRGEAGTPVDDQRLLHAESEPDQWMMVGRDYSEKRFSPLAQINRENVRRLGLAWFFATGSRRGLEATPLVVDGNLYTTNTWSRVYALDAASGELLWSYDPQVPRRWGAYACCDVVNRGVAAWQGKIYLGTLDGRLIALDAATGRPLWSVLTVPQDRPYTITAAPRVVHGKVIIGNGGAEYPGVRGYISAYDANDGHLVWRFYTVPGPEPGAQAPVMVNAARTWSGLGWQAAGGGGTVWSDLAYDPELNLIYFGTGNPSPWNSRARNPDGKDNLFTASIVALDADTGVYRWHFQTTPDDAWDYDAGQNLVLADLDLNAKRRRVVMQANKNGFFYVLDRETGQFLSGRAFVDQNWAKGLDPKTGRPIVAGLPYAANGKFVSPSPLGGHNWQPMAFNPQTGLVYIPANEAPFLYQAEGSFPLSPSHWYTGLNLAAESAPTGIDPLLLRAVIERGVAGQLIAWDPIEQKTGWRVRQPSPWNGGVLTTAAGLVFQGTADGRFVAYDAQDGKLLWQQHLPNGIIAAPMTYTIGGRQHVAVMMGWGGSFGLAAGEAAKVKERDYAGYLLVYALDGRASLPSSRPTSRSIPGLPKIVAGNQALADGNRLYNQHCAVCHGANAISSSALPDLRYMAPETHRRFEQIVRSGTLSKRGMVGFADVLSTEEVQDIHAYLIKRAEITRAAERQPRWWAQTKVFLYGLIAPLLYRLQALRFS